MSVLSPRVLRALHEMLLPYLAGMDARDWLRLLRENRFAVDPIYWLRAGAITVATIRTAAQRSHEERVFGPAVGSTRVEPPLFVLGEARSGTTHLHRLLAQDRQLAYANLYQVTHPHTFLSTEARGAARVASWLPTTRHQDGMRSAVGEPEEDESALAILSRCSPALRRTFPRSLARYNRYVTFRDVPPDELARWKAAFSWFLKKLTWKNRRPLVLKSPNHTARIRHLLDFLPETRFVHIHRHPHAVFQSAYRTRLRTRNYLALQAEPAEQVEDGVIRTHARLNEAFFDDRGLIPHGRLCEVRFEDLERDPLGQLHRIYEALDIPWSDDLEPRLRRYLESIREYRKNTYPELSPGMRDRVARAWRRSFEAWGYTP